MGRAMSVGELAEPFDMTLPAVSMHIRTLQKAGLLTQGRDGQLRPCRLDAAPMRELAVWLERYHVFWEQSLEKLDAYAQAVEREIADGTGSDD
jgi:DNA-binding transcriptional ArsR family regulator